MFLLLYVSSICTLHKLPGRRGMLLEQEVQPHIFDSSLLCIRLETEAFLPLAVEATGGDRWHPSQVLTKWDPPRAVRVFLEDFHQRVALLEEGLGKVVLQLLCMLLSPFLRPDHRGKVCFQCPSSHVDLEQGSDSWLVLAVGCSLSVRGWLAIIQTNLISNFIPFTKKQSTTVFLSSYDHFLSLLRRRFSIIRPPRQRVMIMASIMPNINC